MSGLLLIAQPGWAQKIGEVINHEGGAQIKEGDEPKGVHNGEAVTVNSELRTNGGKLSVYFHNEQAPGLLDLAPGTIVSLPPTSGRALLSGRSRSVDGNPCEIESAEPTTELVVLEKGKVHSTGSIKVQTGPGLPRAKVEPQRPGPSSKSSRSEAPAGNSPRGTSHRLPSQESVTHVGGTANARVPCPAEGSEFIVSYDDATQLVEVVGVGGAVEVSSPAGTVIVCGGESTVVESGRAPTKPSPLAQPGAGLLAVFGFIGGGAAQSQALEYPLVLGHGLKENELGSWHIERADRWVDPPIDEPPATVDLSVQF